jgi:hypothetical protein
MLEKTADGVTFYWTEKARTAFAPSWGHPPGNTRPGGTDVSLIIRSPRVIQAESQGQLLPFCEYPKWKYHWNREPLVVDNLAAEKALGVGWAETAAAFAPYKGARPARTDDQDPAKWLDKWSVPGLTPALRKKIKAHLWRVDSAFERSPDPEAAVPESMRQAFDGIARVLFDAGILTEDLSRRDIPEFVWNSAIAAGWWRLASETPQCIFPEQIGYYWVWRDDGGDWKRLFRAETREWLAALLDAPSHADREADQKELESPESEETPAQSAIAGNPSFDSEMGRNSAVAAYCESWTCSEASLARTARVNPADLSKWKKGLLPGASDKLTRIEKALKNNQPPTPISKQVADI